MERRGWLIAYLIENIEFNFFWWNEFIGRWVTAREINQRRRGPGTTRRAGPRGKIQLIRRRRSPRSSDPADAHGAPSQRRRNLLNCWNRGCCYDGSGGSCVGGEKTRCRCPLLDSAGDKYTIVRPVSCDVHFEVHRHRWDGGVRGHRIQGAKKIRYVST